MNKDVIYIEPEDDITDIILKIENSKEKIVALVPPKKAGVFRSVVNIKLIAKAGTTSEKSVVLVTVDPSITKLAAATKLPVAKNLQSAPTVPKLDNEDADDDSEKAELVEDKDGEVEAEDEKDEEDEKKEEEKEDEDDEKEDDDEDEEDDEEEDDDEEEKPKKKDKKKSKKQSGGLKNWIKEHKKLSIAAGIALAGIIILLIWMLFIAPAVDISVSIKTDKKNFSENVTFVDKLEDENAKEGKFYLEQKKIEETQKVEFEATGKKNIGDKATGDVVVYAYFKEPGSIPINAGTAFYYNNLAFYSDDNVTLSYSGSDDEKCDNAGQISSLVNSGCQKSARVKVTAGGSGEKYNILASNSGWSAVARITGVYSDKPMTGGTDNEITVVQQSDVIAAQNQVKSSKEEENKEKLFEKIKSESDDKYYIIDSSFEQTTSDDVVTPAVDEEVKEGVKPTLEVKTTSTVYVIDKVKLEEYVDEKAKLEDDQKVYDIKDIYIENMSHIAVGATTKLKAQYFVGPKLTSEELMGRIMGKGIGDARREIMDINGVSDVKIETSYPWVMAIPNDSNKVSVKFEIKDQDGNDIKPKDEENQSEDNEDEKNDEDKKDEKDDKKE